MIITKPEDKDFKQIADINNRAEEPFRDICSQDEIAEGAMEMATEETMRDTLKRREMLVAKDGDKIFGYITFRNKHDAVVWVSSLYVDPDFQKKGIGRKLIESVEKFAKDSNCKLVALETHKDATWAINFYKKLGYELVNDKCDAFPYSKMLEKPPVPNRPIFGKLI